MNEIEGFDITIRTPRPKPHTKICVSVLSIPKVLLYRDESDMFFDERSGMPLGKTFKACGGKPRRGRATSAIMVHKAGLEA